MDNPDRPDLCPNAMALRRVSLGDEHIELDLVRRLDDRDVPHLRYRVR
jgi:hypothetical protein